MQLLHRHSIVHAPELEGAPSSALELDDHIQLLPVLRAEIVLRDFPATRDLALPGHAAHRLLVALNERPESRAIAGERAHHEGDVVFTTVAHALGDRCTHERYTNRIPQRLNRRAQPEGAQPQPYSQSVTRPSSTIQVGTGAPRDPNGRAHVRTPAPLKTPMPAFAFKH